LLVVVVAVPEDAAELVLEVEDILEPPDPAEAPDPLEPDAVAVLPPEPLEPPELDFDAPALALLLALDFAVGAGVLAPPPEPPAVPVPPWPPDAVVPVWPDVPEVPERPAVPAAPAPDVPPTMPIRASTSHRTTVLVALSRVPFSTIISTTSPRSTATSSTVAAAASVRKEGR
jgi:hypothetical protein